MSKLLTWISGFPNADKEFEGYPQDTRREVQQGLVDVPKALCARCATWSSEFASL